MSLGVAMAAAVVNRNILVGRPCMSLSTITLAWPSLASSPIRRPTPPSPSSGMRLTSSLATASSSALCSPTTAAAIAPTSFAKLVCRWASNTAVLALTRRKPTAKPNASSRPLCANGPMPLTGPTPTNVTSPSLPGPITTTTPVLMVAFTTSRPSAAPNQVQPLDHLQMAPPTQKTYLATLVKSDAVEQVGKAWVAAHGIKEGVYSKEL